MRALRPAQVVALCLAGLLLATAAQTQALRVGGTGSALGLLQQVGTEFTASTEVKVNIVPALGSAGAIRALADGKLDLAVSARPLKPEEAAAGLVQAAGLRTAFVLATSHQNANGLRSDALAGIFAADKPSWADGTPIRIILRPRRETDSALLGDLFPGMAAALESARRRTDVPTAATDQDNVDLAERVSGALVGTSATQLATEHPKLRALPLDGVAPSFANFESGAYRFTKRLYVLIRSNGSPENRRFIEFLRSPQGMRSLRAAEALLDAE